MLLLVASVAAMVLMVPSAHGQLIAAGACPTVTVQATFIPAQYAGAWFEQEKYFALFELGGSCISATYTLTGNPNTLSVVNREFSTLKNRYLNAMGTATWRTPGGQARLGVSFPQVFDFGLEAPYWILSTDYTTFSVVYSCTDQVGGLFNTQNAWILTRAQVATDATLAAARAVLTANNLSLTALKKTTQTNCL